ncbi:MAG: CrcB family protein [Rhodospirillaceae bacterium]
MLVDYLVFGVGSGLGGMVRYLLATDPVLGFAQVGHPVDTMVVNAIGSFLAGYTVSLSVRALTPTGRSFLIGLAGGITTYSAFSLETVQFLQHVHLIKAALYASASVVTYVAAAAAGFVAADWVERV